MTEPPQRAENGAERRSADRRLLQEAVREAGRLALDYWERRPKGWDKGPGQVVTEADFAVDRLLAEALRPARPDYGWLSEETEDTPERLSRRRVWVVDPIDGTRSFVEGRPEFAVSVALVEDGRPVLGAVFNPARDEFYEAAEGEGAFCNGAPLAVSTARALAGARLLASRTELRRRRWIDRFPRSEITAMGSLAYKLVLVAAGRFDASISIFPCSDWDIAAAQIVLSEAGGRTTTLAGEALAFNRATVLHPTLVAAPPTLHGLILDEFRRA